ncbi:hypothetical protein F5Y19DRAFT_470921 [Xylariaceae sp. FL1651]|nr:hypothetical protein F5Y19DRAFT_470921 [Xylariaceae sp. FL1651]
MAADGGQPHRLACLNCKHRKKKCDKELPLCGYCVRKGLLCSYQNNPRSNNHAYATVGGALEASRRTSSSSSPPAVHVFIPSAADAIPAEVQAETSLYLQVNRTVRSTGQFVDDITARYFQGIHRFMPVVSRARFHRSLITLGSAPAADFSVLLLSICLITYDPSAATIRTGGIDRHSILVSARSLFAQLQVVASPSVHLIQAGLLLALYEYAHGKPEAAFASIANCARMAYAAGIHRQRQRSDLSPTCASGLTLDAEEAANTWWGLAICERMMICEVAVPDQPLVTIFPGETSQLPIEPDVMDQRDIFNPGPISTVLLSSFFTVNVGGFGRAAQAASLLDQVLKAISMLDLKGRLVHLDSLDSTLQSFLTVIMQQRDGNWGVYCGAIALAIRTLFTLHWHILDLAPADIVNAKYKTLDKWLESSHSALETITKMTLDIADSHQSILAHKSDTLPPNCAYMINAALRYLRRDVVGGSYAWRQSAESRLRNSLGPLDRRWGRDSD